MQNEQRKDYWIPVATSKGMFSSEYAIELKLADGQTVSFFADKELVKEQEGQKKLKVTLVNTDAQHHTDLVLLPSETLETSTRWAMINSAKAA